MHINHYKQYSNILGRKMEFQYMVIVVERIVVFPGQDGRFYDFENFGMVDAVEKI